MPSADLSSFDLAQLPTTEDDEFEFKSTRTREEDLKKKMGCAASGFANSGGGYFVVGVNDNGDADGGIPAKIGTQDRRDWCDQVIQQVQPPPNYDIKLIDDPSGHGRIDPNSVVVVLSIKESHVGPHMAPDGRYYIRAGAHTVRARHFIVDAIWAKRHFSKPRVTHLCRPKPDDQDIIELGIVALSDSPALSVHVEMTFLGEVPSHMGSFVSDFPIEIGVIDRQTPFFFDVTTRISAEKGLDPDIRLRVTYQDLAGNQYDYEGTIDVRRSFPSLRFYKDEQIVKALESIEAALRDNLK